MLLAAFFFACMHGFIKKVVDFHVFEITFFRSIITAILCMLYLKHRRISIRGNHLKPLFLRSIFGLISMVLFFATLQRMPLGASVTLKYLSPVFTAIFAIYFLNERVRPAQWVFVITAFVGVLLLKGFDSRIDTLSLAMGIVGAVFGGLVYVMIRRIGASEHPMVIINHFMVLSAVLTGLAMIPYWRMPNATESLYLIAVGTLGYFGQVYMTKALQLEMASRVAPVKYIEVVYSLILGLIWFGEGYSFLSLIGILLIISSMLLNLMFKQQVRVVSS